MQISILLQITGANSLLSMCTLKMVRQHELKIWLVLPICPKTNCPFYYKDAENTKKATKVALASFRSYLEEKGSAKAS